MDNKELIGDEQIRHHDRKVLTRFHVTTMVLLAACLILVTLMFYLGVRAGQKCVRETETDNLIIRSPGPGNHSYL